MYMKLKEITACVKDYIKNPNTDYAIAINGEWGSGKTLFWNSTIKNIVIDNHNNPVYISLSSIGSISELRTLLFSSVAVGVTKEKHKLKLLLLNFLQIVGRWISSESSYKLSFITPALDVLTSLYAASVKLDKHVICIDDLERCTVSMVQVFGFLSELIEQRGAKVIILMDEKHVKGEEYKIQKEKVIRWTFDFNGDIESIFASLISKYHHENINFKQCLEHHKDYIIALTNEYQIKNIRTFIFITDILCNTFKYWDHVKSEYQQSIILFAVVVTIANKRGDFITVIGRYNGIDRIDSYFPRLVELEKENRLQPSIINDFQYDFSYAPTFYKDFLINRLKQYVFLPQLFDFITSGILDGISLQEFISAKFTQEIGHHEKVLENLLGIYTAPISDSELIDSFNYFLEYLEEGRYSFDSVIRSVYSTNNLIEEGLITLTDIEMIQYYKKALEKIATDLNTKEARRNLRFDERTSFITQIKETIEGYLDDIDKINKDELSLGFIRCIAQGDQSFMFNNYHQLRYWKEFSLHTNVKKLVDALEKAPEQSLIDFRLFIRDRYNFSNIHEAQPNDDTFLQDLNIELNKAIHSSKPTSKMRNFYFQLILEEIASALGRYNIDVTQEENPDSRIVE